MYTVPIKTKALTYGEACKALTLQMRVGIDPVLETVVEMLEVLGNPQTFFDVIQIGGTNGKTSTSRYTAAFLQAGLKEESDNAPKYVPLVGLYTSPELERINERIVIAGKDVADELFATGVAAAQAAGEKVNHERLLAGEGLYNITQFDLLTVAALVVFALQGVKVAVLEVGMGGRWDATTATAPLITAITGVDLDHTKILGETKAQIAEEKAAIIKPGQRVFLGEGVLGDAEVRPILESRCVACGLEPEYISIQDSLLQDLSGMRIPHYQAANIALAKALAEAYLNHNLSAKTTASVLEHTHIPGRFELLSNDPLHIIDAAHNPQSVRISMDELAAFQVSYEKPINVLVAIFADKDTKKMAAIIAHSLDPAAGIYVTQTQNERCLSAARLAEIFSEAGRAPVRIFESVPEACNALASEDYFAIGTITLAGEVKTCENRG